jgi:RHS repeat-associated protein
LTYDSFGRITNLPASFAGGKALSTEYFSNDMVASQSQNGVTNTFQLDATLRQRQRLQAGGLEGTEVFHYAGPGDSPSWTQRGSTWTRSITGIGGELAAIHESGKGVVLQLTNLHGDVVATAALSPAVTELKSTATYDEFGSPTGGSAGRFGWLGGKQRRTELASGVIQMGARSYVPQIGRFLTPDPVFGGSANPYDYANQDPVNMFDLSGKWTANPKRWREKARQRARESNVRPVACYGKQGCVPATKGTGFKIPPNTLKVMGKVYAYIQDPVKNNPVMERIRDYVYGLAASTTSEEKTRLMGCAKAAVEGYRDAGGLDAFGKRGEAARWLWSGTQCAISWFS